MPFTGKWCNLPRLHLQFLHFVQYANMSYYVLINNRYFPKRYLVFDIIYKLSIYRGRGKW